MRALLRLLFGVLTLLPLLAHAVPAAVAEFTGTWRASSDGTTIHVRIEPDGRVDFASPVDGSTLSGRAMVGNLMGRSAFTGMLPNGDVFSVGYARGTPALSIGSTLLAMERIPAQRFGTRESGAAGATPPAGGGTGAMPPAGAAAAGSAMPPVARSAASVAGLRLSMAKGGNGYFIERSYDFCADGRVFTRWAEQQMSQFGSGASERTDQGTWRQDGATLQLQLARGGAVSFAVQRPEAGVVRLDATGYAAEPSRRCR